MIAPVNNFSIGEFRMAKQLKTLDDAGESELSVYSAPALAGTKGCRPMPVMAMVRPCAI